jgi:hypothetical protein
MTRPVASARATNSNLLRMPIGRLSACVWIESEASCLLPVVIVVIFLHLFLSGHMWQCLGKAESMFNKDSYYDCLEFITWLLCLLSMLAPRH